MQGMTSEMKRKVTGIGTESVGTAAKCNESVRDGIRNGPVNPRQMQSCSQSARNSIGNGTESNWNRNGKRKDNCRTAVKV